MSNKLRILCLHGFTSNGSVHAHQVRKITSRLSNEYEFLFPDGPHIIELSTQMSADDPMTKLWSDYVTQHSTSGHRGWWVARDPNPEGNQPDGFVGLEESLASLGQLLETTGPVHAIWGFSQGACLAGMLTALLAPKLQQHPLRQHLPTKQGVPGAGIFFSGFRARFSQYDSVYEEPIDTPTLHVIGEKDTSVTPDRSKTLLNRCAVSEVLTHTGGHDIPKSEEDQDVVVRFVRQHVRAEGNASL